MNQESSATSEQGRLSLADWLRKRYDEHPLRMLAVQSAVVFALAVLVAWFFWGPRDAAPVGDGIEFGTAAAVEGPSLWTCAMHPQIRQPKPGACPICQMDLISVTQSAGGMRTLELSPEAKALMRIEVAPVERMYVSHEVPMVGRVDYDETRFGYITAWVSGRLDRLYVDYTGVEVRKGDHMANVYSEQLYAAQQELIQARKYDRSRAANPSSIQVNLVESSREKLRLLGLTKEQIAEIEKSDKPTDQLTIYAPMGGVVIEKLKQQGERVELGERIYTIADLSRVWVHLDAYESDLPWIRYGQDVTVTTEAYPGEEFHGRIAFIQPVLNDKTRTVKVRVNVPNEDDKLKPDMFVRAVVRPKVAAGGKVMDPALSGKWISPMHPEIVKDGPGTCDICGMALVPVESLGYISPAVDGEQPPLTIPYLAALVTGTRAIVYVQLPNMPSFAEPALQTLSAVVDEGELHKIHDAFITYGNMLDRPYDQPGTAYAKQLWNKYADRLAQDALLGYQAETKKEAEQVLSQLTATMNEAREQFASAENPTFEGREIVLGPRAGDYYLVRHGLDEGELVVTQGNFKLDSEIQIQAKPSMMTPEGGGGGGHDHGAPAAGAAKGHNAESEMALPAKFHQQVRELETAFDEVAKAVRQRDVAQASAAFEQFGQALSAVDGSILTGHPRMLWKEFAMLLGNDAAEGTDAEQLADANRVFLSLKGNMRRMREQIGVMPDARPAVEHIAVPASFQGELARVWTQYLGVGRELAADNMGGAKKVLSQLVSAVANVNDQALSGQAESAWTNQRSKLQELISGLEKSQDIKAMRESFYPVSQEIGVLAKTFGFGTEGRVYELRCPMAFQGRGATWYQDNDDTRNPYFGAEMLKCADRVEEIAPNQLALPM